MVAQLLGLKLRLLGGSFRRSVWHVVGFVVSVVYGLGIAVLCFGALVGARLVPDVGLLRDLFVVIGAVVIVGFAVVPLFFGSDDTLDPRRFALFGIDRDTLAVGLAVATAVGVPALALAITLVGYVVAWTRGVGETLFAILAALLAFATCLLMTRMATAIAALLLSTRRAREVSGFIGIAFIIVLSPIAVLLAQYDWAGSGHVLLTGLADALSWTPLGAVWAIPGDAALGDWGGALLHLVIATATLGVLWYAWTRLVALILVTPGRETSGQSYTGLGWFGRVPPGSAGAIAARSITYWIRDSRYWMSLLMIPVLPVLLVVPLAAVQVPTGVLALLPVPVMCVFLGWTVHNDVAYDSTAVWLHVSSGVSGAADRIGRLVPALALGIPLIAIGTIVSLQLYGDWSVLPSFVGICTSLFLVGLGCGSYTSARFPYPVPKPGASPFAQPQSSGAAAVAVQSLSFLFALLFTAPAFVFAGLAIYVDPQWHLAAFIDGVGTGLIVLVLGIWWGAHTFDQRGPEILLAAQRA
ncbi:MAG: hypothetical protein ABWY36_01075 [Leifsonia sp.]